MASVDGYRHISALVNVGSSGNDLKRLFLAQVQLADHQAVCIRMLFNFIYSSQFNAGNARSQFLAGFQIGTAHNHAVEELVDRYLDICIIL